MSMTFTITRDHAEVINKHGGQRQCGCQWFVLLPETMWKFIISASTDGKTTFAVKSVKEDSQLRKRGTEGFCENPYSSQK